MTSGVDLLNGLAVLFGIDRLAIAGITDGPDNDYVAQAEGALAALEDHDLVVVHVESPDEAGHAGDVAAKIAGIEAIDREVLSRVLAYGDDAARARHAGPPDAHRSQDARGRRSPIRRLRATGIDPNGALGLHGG